MRRSDRPQQPAVPKLDSTMTEASWQEIQTTLQPARLIKLCEDFERDFPVSEFVGQVRHIAAGARQALEIQYSTGLAGDFFEEPFGDLSHRDNLAKAVRGDKDAAYRVALAYKTGWSGIAASSRRMEQWLRFSAELGNGQASWELAEIYNRGGLIADAAHFEKKARDLGYLPPIRLPTRGY